jgi:hypothetical protein
MRQVQESPTDYQGEYEYANPRRHCRENLPQKTHLAEQHISKEPSVLRSSFGLSNLDAQPVPLRH